MNKQQKEDQIRALLRELEGYEQYDRSERAESVREQLKALGHKSETPHKRSTKMTRDSGKDKL